MKLSAELNDEAILRFGEANFGTSVSALIKPFLKSKNFDSNTDLL